MVKFEVPAESAGYLGYLLCAAVFIFLFGVNSLGFLIALLPGFIFSYLFIEARNLVRFLLSLPLTMFLVLVPSWALNMVGIPVNGNVLIGISLFFSVVGFYLAWKTKKIDFGAKKFTSEHALILLLLLVIAFVSYPLGAGQLPRTDGAAHYYKSWLLEAGLDQTGTIPIWDSNWYAGYPLFDFYPPFSYYLTVYLNYFTNAGLNNVFDYIMILSFVWLGLGVFALSKHLGFNDFSSFMAGAIAVVSPRLSTNMMFSGQYPTILAFSMIPIAVVIFLKCFEEKKYASLSAILIAVVFLTHHLTGYFTAVIFGLAFALNFLSHKKKAALSFVYAAVLSMLLALFWLAPFAANMKYSEYASPREPGFNPDVFLVLFSSPSRDCADFYCFQAMGLEFTILAAIGLLVSILNLKVGRDKVSVNPGFEKNRTFVVLMFLAVLFLALAPFLGITKYLPFGSSFGAERFTFYLVFPIALLAGSILEIINGFHSKDFVIFGAVITVVLFLLLWKYVDLTNYRAGNWNNENAPLATSGLSDLYTELKQLPDGRVLTYGIFQGAIVAAIPIQAEKPSISGWYPQGSYNYKKIAGLLEDVSGQSLFNFGLSSKFTYSLYEKSWTRWIVVNLCSAEGQSAVNNTFLQDERYLVVWRNGNQQGCLVVVEVPDTFFAESVSLVKIEGDYENIRKKIYDTDYGYAITIASNRTNIADSEFRAIVGKDVLWDDGNAEELVNLLLASRTPLQWEREGSAIRLFNTTGWTSVKETYYPYWHAYQNGNEIPIYQSDLDFMLIKSEGDVELRIERGIYQYAPSAVSFVVFAALLFFLVVKTFRAESPKGI